MTILEQLLTVADQDLQTTVVVGGGRGGALGGNDHPDSEMRGVAVSKKFFRPFGPQFSLKIRGEQGARVPPLDPPMAKVLSIRK